MLLCHVSSRIVGTKFRIPEQHQRSDYEEAFRRKASNVITTMDQVCQGHLVPNFGRDPKVNPRIGSEPENYHCDGRFPVDGVVGDWIIH